jgi:hypothetical protein
VSRAIPGLLLALLLQLALVALIYWPAVAPLESTEDPGVPPLNAVEVDAVVIGDSDGNLARLERRGDAWRLPALQGLPADPEKVAKLLDALLTTAYQWPVANSTAARQRFEVADYLHRRRVELLSGGETRRVLYLGTSPGFRKVHARIEGHDDIRSLAFNVHDAPATDGAWVDPRLLQVRTPMRIVADAYSVQRDGGEWRSGAGRVPDERELLALLTALRSLRVEGVAGQGAAGDLAGAEAELVLAIDSLSGQVEWSLYRRDGQYLIRSSEFPLAFRISAYDFDRLTGIDFLLMSGEDTTR